MKIDDTERNRKNMKKQEETGKREKTGRHGKRQEEMGRDGKKCEAWCQKMCNTSFCDDNNLMKTFVLKNSQ